MVEGQIIAKITQQHWLADKQVWKYNFLNIENNQQDFFYHDKQIGYNSNVVSKLTLDKDKFLQSFEQEIANSEEITKRSEILIQLEEQAQAEAKRLKLPKKKIKLSLDIQTLHKLHNQGFTWKQVASIYEKHEQSIYYWLRTQDKVLQKRGCKPKFDKKVLELLLEYNQINNTATQQERADYVSKQIGQVISQQTVSLFLKKLGITRKKLTYHYTQLDEMKAKAFNEEIKPLLLNNQPFIALDECSFYPKLDPRFGYSFRGSRAINQKPSHKGKHYTLLFAISNLKRNGVIKWKLTGEKVDWKVFYDFLEEINPIGNKKNILLMDNARIHTAKNKRSENKLPTTEEQMLRKNTEVKFITTYAPMLNPTELVFNLFRQQTEKQRPRNYEEMKLAIEKVVELLNKKDLSGYFRHCAEYFDEKPKIKL